MKCNFQRVLQHVSSGVTFSLTAPRVKSPTSSLGVDTHLALNETFGIY